jgi:histidinol dehydrogenase
MANSLDEILIEWDRPGASVEFDRLYSEIKQKATFIGNADERKKVREICQRVWEGDEAVAEYTEKFDGVKLKPEEFGISTDELKNAHNKLEKNDPLLLASIRQAIQNVRTYQTEIFIGRKNTNPGIKYTPVRRVGICVPGASAPLPSTVIMCAVPAQVAGVQEIAVVSPPRYEKSIHPVILATCYELGVKEVYRIGGVQAVAALAYGTEKIKAVDKIVGPGNQWVQTAKLELFGYVGIDSIAGPSEVLIIADDSAKPEYVAADMLSQAEHDPGIAVLFTASKQLADRVLTELKKQVPRLDRSAQTEKCLVNSSRIVVFKNPDDIIKNANDFAAEHLQIQCGDESRTIADKIQNAGAIFIGDYTPVAVGDYWDGPSHTLPTGTSARFFSALSANDFVKSTSIIKYDKNKLMQSADDIIRLAKAEGLDAHARSVQIRMQ